MDDINIFVPFSKKDNDKRLVGGYASSEALDSQGEVVEKDAIARALPGYLGEYDQKTGKYRYGNLREMHQLSAVGKTVKAKIDNKGLYIDGKVVDDVAWKKVKEGVYAGFSIGGKIIKQVGNRIKDLKLSEISLVDRPANPEAIFLMVKADNAGKMQDVQKDEMTDSPHEMKPDPHTAIGEAGHLLELAQELRMIRFMLEMDGRSTIELDKALTALKTLASKILTGDNRKKFEHILYGISNEEMESLIKAKLPNPTITQSTKKAKVSEISKYIDTNWTAGYFGEMKKVMG